MNKIIFPLLLILFTACKIETGTDESSHFQVFQYANGQVDFTVLHDKVLAPECMQCHSWVNSEAEVLKRIIPGNAEQSTLYQLVKTGQMPSGQPRLTDQALKLVEQYITYNKSTVKPPIPIAPTYNSLQANLFEKSCVGCHNPDVLIKHPSRPLLTTKEAIIARYDDVLYSITDAWTIDDNEMPPTESKIPRVSTELINALKAWKDNGFPD